MRSLFQVALLVEDYDKAIAWFTASLGLIVKEDTDSGAGKRWVVLTSGGGADILLAKAVDDTQLKLVGNQFGGRVGFFLKTDFFDQDYSRMKSAGVNFLETPRAEAYGKVVKFADLYGNGWDLIEPV